MSLGEPYETRKAKCKVSRVGHSNFRYQHKLGDGRLENSPTEKDLGTLVGGSWT